MSIFVFYCVALLIFTLSIGVLAFVLMQLKSRLKPQFKDRPSVWVSLMVGIFAGSVLATLLYAFPVLNPNRVLPLGLMHSALGVLEISKSVINSPSFLAASETISWQLCLLLTYLTGVFVVLVRLFNGRRRAIKIAMQAELARFRAYSVRG